jgi:peptidoglycan hydrolase-like protein with peptidoglycan-binding domain
MVLSSARFSRGPELQRAAHNQPPLKVGARGAAVKSLQQALVDLGFNLPRSITNGFPDGIYGSETETNVKAFQRSRFLVIDGIAGRETLNHLDKIFSDLEDQIRRKEIAEILAPFPFGKTFTS